MRAAQLILAFVLGSAMGTLGGVIAHRVPLDQPPALPGAACPSCAAPLRWFDSLPLLSYLALRARCRSCGQRIPARYPLIELTMGAVWLLVVRRIGLHAELPAYLAFATALVILSFIDLATHRLPNRVLGPASIVAVVALVGAAAVTGHWSGLEHAATGAVAYGLPMLVLGLAAPSAMGGGDVKFAPYLGFHLGWFGLRLVFSGALLGLISGGLGGALLLVVGRKGMKDAIPFGPFMAFGALAAILLGPLVVRPFFG
ncbi:MAG: A24 family peptidase [Actinomycetota bacterium]